MDGLIIKLPTAVTNDSLPVLGEFRVPLVKKGTGSTRSALKFTLSGASEMTIKGGDFYSASSGGTALSKTVSTVSGNNTFYLQITDSEGYISFKDSSKITSIGFSGQGNVFLQGVGLLAADENINGVAPIINIDLLPKNIVTFAISPDTILNGDINSFKRAANLASIYIQQNMFSAPKSTFGGVLTSDIRTGSGVGSFYIMTSKNITIPLQYLKGSTNIDVRLPFGATSAIGTVKLTGSLSSIPATVTDINIPTGVVLESTSNLSELSGKTSLTRINIAGNTTLVGSLSSLPANVTDAQIYTNTSITYTGTKVWGAPMRSVYLPNSVLSTPQIDQLLIDLAAATWDTGRPVVLKGVRSSASDAAMSTLASKSVNVTFL